MNQQTEHEGGEEHSKENAKGTIPDVRKRPVFQKGYLANNDWAILLLCTIAMFVAAILPNSDRAKTIYWVLMVLSTLGLIIHWITKRHEVTDEEIDKAHRKQVESSLGSLNTRLQSAEAELTKQRPRRLTAEQKAIIQAVMSRFPGQMCSVEVPSMSTEPMLLGQDLYETLLAAGCRSSFSGSSYWMPSFCVRVHVHSSYRESGANAMKPLPEAFSALLGTLVAAGLAKSPPLINIDDAVPIGEVRIRVGTQKEITA